MSDRHQLSGCIMPRLEHFTCEHCTQMVFDNSNSVRWYHLDFCSLKCVRLYFECRFRVCATCQTTFTDGKMQIYHSALELYAFCDSNCMDTYRFLNDPCSFCFAMCSKNGRHARSVGKKKYCTLHCIMTNGRIVGNKFNGGKCYSCPKKRSNLYQIKMEKENLWNVCSDDCLKLFELNANVKLATCSVCHVKYDGNSYDAAQLEEYSGEKRIFCSKICRSHHLKNDSKKCVCIECGESCRYYEMIRTLSTDVAEKMWCSLDCAGRQVSSRLSNVHIELVNRELRGIYCFDV